MSILDNWLSMGTGRVVELGRTGSRIEALATLTSEGERIAYAAGKAETTGGALVALEAALRAEAEALIAGGGAAALDSTEVTESVPNEIADDAEAMDWLEGALAGESEPEEAQPPPKPNGRPRRRRAPPAAEDQG